MLMLMLTLGFVLPEVRNVQAGLASSVPQQVTVTFTVEVFDANTGSPISGVSVYLDGNFQGTTDSNGNVGVSTIYPPANHPYRVSASGYQDMTGTWTIGSNSGGYVTVRLTPNASPPSGPQQVTVTFTVQVLDGNTASPISGASVWIDNNLAGYTGSNGNLGVAATYPPVDHPYSVSASGYQTQSGTWIIGSNSGGYFTVRLTPNTSPSGNRLQVQLIPQHYDLDCWAASSAMVIGYYAHTLMSPGFEVKIQQALEQLVYPNGYVVSGTTQGVPLQVGWFGPAGPYVNVMAQFGVQVNTVHGLSFNRIISEIDGGHPIIVLKDNGDGTGHIMVVVGYSGSDQVLIDNPWPVDQGDQYWLDYASLHQELYRWPMPDAITMRSMRPTYSVIAPLTVPPSLTQGLSTVHVTKTRTQIKKCALVRLPSAQLCWQIEITPWSSL